MHNLSLRIIFLSSFAFEQWSEEIFVFCTKETRFMFSFEHFFLLSVLVERKKQEELLSPWMCVPVVMGRIMITACYTFKPICFLRHHRTIKSQLFERWSISWGLCVGFCQRSEAREIARGEVKSVNEYWTRRVVQFVIKFFNQLFYKITSYYVSRLTFNAVREFERDFSSWGAIYVVSFSPTTSCSNIGIEHVVLHKPALAEQCKVNYNVAIADLLQRSSWARWRQVTS